MEGPRAQPHRRSRRASPARRRAAGAGVGGRRRRGRSGTDPHRRSAGVLRAGRRRPTSVSKSCWLNPDWSFAHLGSGHYERLLEALEGLVAANPATTFIAAHVAGAAEDLDRVERWLGAYPNLFVDIAARIAELGRQPRRARQLIVRHADRVLFGTDVFPPEPGRVRDPLPLPRDRGRAFRLLARRAAAPGTLAHLRARAAGRRAGPGLRRERRAAHPGLGLD